MMKLGDGHDDRTASGKGFAAWDLIADLPPPAEHDPGAPRPPQHARERTRIVESPDAGSLRSELARRRIYWRTTPRPAQMRMSPGRELVRILPTLAVPAAFLLLIAILVAGINMLWTPRTRPALLFIVPAAAGIFGLAAMVRTARATHRVREQRCPDCAYDLSGTPSELDPTVYGVETGPRCCSECGALWPLVPPAAPPRPRA